MLTGKGMGRALKAYVLNYKGNIYYFRFRSGWTQDNQTENMRRRKYLKLSNALKLATVYSRLKRPS